MRINVSLACFLAGAIAAVLGAHHPSDHVLQVLRLILGSVIGRTSVPKWTPNPPVGVPAATPSAPASVSPVQPRVAKK